MKVLGLIFGLCVSLTVSQRVKCPPISELIECEYLGMMGDAWYTCPGGRDQNGCQLPDYCEPAQGKN